MSAHERTTLSLVVGTYWRLVKYFSSITRNNISRISPEGQRADFVSSWKFFFLLSKSKYYSVLLFYEDRRCMYSILYFRKLSDEKPSQTCTDLFKTCRKTLLPIFLKHIFIMYIIIGSL